MNYHVLNCTWPRAFTLTGYNDAIQQFLIDQVREGDRCMRSHRILKRGGFMRDCGVRQVERVTRNV